MGKRIAVVTGASAGIGKEWVKLLIKENVDEVWAIARRKEVLEEMAKECPEKLVPISLDLSKRESLETLEAKWTTNDVDIVWMINNAGIGRTIPVEKETVDSLYASLNLNVEAVTILSYYALRHMHKGSHLINMGSQAGRQPLPYLAIYGATKAFINSWSASLHHEYKKKGIHVMAVTPYWVYSDMLTTIANGKEHNWGKYASSAEEVVERAYKDALKGKVYSINKRAVRVMVRAQKHLPENVSIKVWLKEAKKLCDID